MNTDNRHQLNINNIMKMERFRNIKMRRLEGGINNEVYSWNERDKQWVLKFYKAEKKGMTDKMKAEIDFLRYAKIVADDFAPELIETDNYNRYIILEYIHGERFYKGELISKKDLESAVEFFKKLNNDKSIAQKFISMQASEGYLHITEHIENVDRRIKRIENIELRDEVKAELDKLLITAKNIYLRRKERILKRIDSGDINDAIDDKQLCVSPSDFGFHNAIRTKNGVKFIDFEFAGWDDPNKASIDFSLQPRIPVKQSTEFLANSLNKRKNYNNLRHKAIRDILEIKWICIMLKIVEREKEASNYARKECKSNLDERFKDVQKRLDYII